MVCAKQQSSTFQVRMLGKIRKCINFGIRRLRRLVKRDKKLFLSYVKLTKLSTICKKIENSRKSIRKSIRKTETNVRKEKQELVAKKINSGIEEGLKMVKTDIKGRGIVATKAFKRGEFVVEYSGVLMDNDAAKKRDLEYAQDEAIGCYLYYFLHNSRTYCVDATEETGKFGRLINHSKRGNLSTKSFVIGDIPHLIFIANRDISPTEELLYDYGDRRRETIEANPWLAA